MIVLLLMSLVCLILTFYASRNEIPFGLEISFLIIAFFAAIHYNYGNDYKSYVDIFYYINKFDINLFDLFGGRYYKEIGWATLCYLFKPFGFLFMVAVLAVFQNLVYYFFIKKFVHVKWWLLSVFIYLFSTSLYVMNMSMMRQGLAGSLFLLSFMIIQKKNVAALILALFLLYLATTIHVSSVILLPFIFICFLKKEVSPYMVIPIVILAMFFAIKPDYIYEFIYAFEDVDGLQTYVRFAEDSGESFGLGTLWKILPFFVVIYCCLMKKISSDFELQVNFLAMVCYVTMIFQLFVPMISRLGFYFAPFMLASVPYTYEKLPYLYRVSILGLFVSYFLLAYFKFFYNPIWHENFFTFHTIFEVLF